jgi:DNA-binding transcriptional MerR regulator
MAPPRSIPDAIAALPPEGVSLEELADAANALLASSGVTVRDGRTGERIDARTIRFYQTLGILPKPGYTGRRASYGEEHLLRVVAAKQLQSEGYSLAQIQAALPQRTAKDLLRALTKRSDAGRAAAAPIRSVASSSVEAPPTTNLLSVQLAEGVTLLIDPTRVADPHRLALLLARAVESAVAASAHFQGGSR